VTFRHAPIPQTRGLGHDLNPHGQAVH
jgi:hypothetical protein